MKKKYLDKIIICCIVVICAIVSIHSYKLSKYIVDLEAKNYRLQRYVNYVDGLDTNFGIDKYERFKYVLCRIVNDSGYFDDYLESVKNLCISPSPFSLDKDAITMFKFEDVFNSHNEPYWKTLSVLVHEADSSGYKLSDVLTENDAYWVRNEVQSQFDAFIGLVKNGSGTFVH